MSKRRGSLRVRRVGLASIVLVIALLAAPLMSVHASTATILQAEIKSNSGATMGTATFTSWPAGGVKVYIQLQGFNPIGGDHRLAITSNVGACYSPSFACIASEILVLPNIQFYADGSAEYTTVTRGVTMDYLQQSGNIGIVIHADTYEASDIIGRGVISAMPTYSGWPSWSWYGQPGWQPSGQQPPCGWYGEWPTPTPPTTTVRYTVTASDGLRLRSGPGTGYAIQRIVSLGTTLTGTGEEQWGNGLLWARVLYNGSYYWCAKDWLRAY